MRSRTALIAAFLAALLFGASTPFAKMLTGSATPTMLAGLLYLGSGVGLWTIRLIRDGDSCRRDSHHPNGRGFSVRSCPAASSPP
jgi:hypothetical protein